LWKILSRVSRGKTNNQTKQLPAVKHRGKLIMLLAYVAVSGMHGEHITDRGKWIQFNISTFLESNNTPSVKKKLKKK